MSLINRLMIFFGSDDQHRPTPLVRARLMEQWQSYESAVLVANLLAACCFVYAMWPNRPHEQLLVWFAMMVIIVLQHTYFVAMRRPKIIPLADIARWERHLLISTTLAGLTWGLSAIVLFTPDQVLVVLFLAFALFGVATSILAALSAYWIAYPVFAICVLMPLAFSCLRAGGELYTTMGIMTILLMAAAIFFSRASYRALRTSVELRFANLELIEQLKAEKARVELADHAKTRFLAAASHDLRQPIHALGMFASTLAALAAQPAPKPALIQEVAKKLQLSVRGLSSLLNTLLDISKLDAGVIETHPQPIRLQAIFESVEGEFAEAARQKKLLLTLRPAPANLYVQSDPVLLKQILNNLVSNAIRYTEQGRVLVGHRQRGANIEVQVWDTGAGIAEDQREAIFGEFIQLHNPQRDREQGLGLGLSIVKRTAALLGHTILLRSRLGKGSVFSVVLPRAATSTDTLLHDVNKSSETAAPAHDAPHARFPVLVIDDDKEVLDAMRVMVSSWGHPVTAAHSADAAVAALTALPLELREQIGYIISDYRLAEGRTGAEAIRQVLQFIQRDIPAVIITGDTSPDRIREAATSGFTLMHKPLEPERLRALLDEVRDEGG